MGINEIAFFGKITAGVTHELKNVLAIINESNGLMTDLFAMAGDAPVPHRERLLRSIAKIDAQVRRGVDITTRLNRFAHSMDSDKSRVDLNEMVDLTAAMAQRFARLQNLELQVCPAEAPVYVWASRFYLQMALTRVIETCMGAMAQDGGGAVVLTVRGGKAACEICLECRPRGSEALDLDGAMATLSQWREFDAIAAELGITAHRSDEEGGQGLLLCFVPENEESMRERAGHAGD